MISFLYNLISLNTPSELYFKSKSQRSSTLNQCDEHNYQISAPIGVLIFVLHDGKHVDVGPIDSPGRRYMIECFNNLHVTQFRSPCHCDFINIYSQSIQGVSKKRNLFDVEYLKDGSVKSIVLLVCSSLLQYNSIEPNFSFL